jgi:hypothetical protein
MSDFTILWDLEDDPDGNIQHIAEHDISVEEVEDVLRNRLNKTERSRSSGLPITFGWTFTERYIAVVWELANRDPKMVYPVTAYDAEPPSR